MSHNGSFKFQIISKETLVREKTRNNEKQQAFVGWPLPTFTAGQLAVVCRAMPDLRYYLKLITQDYLFTYTRPIKLTSRLHQS
jgi:hypothetical protein